MMIGWVRDLDFHAQLHNQGSLLLETGKQIMMFRGIVLSL